MTPWRLAMGSLGVVGVFWLTTVALIHAIEAIVARPDPHGFAGMRVVLPGQVTCLASESTWARS